MENIAYDLASYADISRVVKEPEYAKSKCLCVKHQPQIYSDQADKLHSLYVIKYDKQCLNAANYHTLGLWRSVVTDGNRVLSFAPPKSLPITMFEEGLECYEYCLVEEFVEGTMVNLFHNPHSGDWEIATRSSVGARCRFYEEPGKTFRTMFMEAMTDNNIEFEMFDKAVCYSFVLQHPDNRIVVPFISKKLVLTNAYRINNGIATLHRGVELGGGANDVVRARPLLEICDFGGNSLAELAIYFSSRDVNYDVVGAMVHNVKTGERTKIRNPSYEYVRELRGNSSKIQYQYYCLRRCGRVGEYLRYYPGNAETFGKLRDSLHQWTHQLWRYYVSCFVKRHRPLGEFPYQFKPHMYQLHQIYLNELREHGDRTTMASVVRYVNALEPARLMHAVNYHLRKQKIDEAKAAVCLQKT